MFLTAGCHNNSLNTGYGVAWLSMTSEPADFASYNVYLDGIILTRTDGALVTAYPASYYEKIDLTKITDLSELIGSYTGVATGTYTAASIVLDYTDATIFTLVNGVPTAAKIVDSSGAAVTTQTIAITFDPANPLVLQPTYATTAATRLAIDVNMWASTRSVDTSTSPATVTVNPFITMSVSAADQRLIRIRGPLINSSVGEQSFTVYVRPFYDQADAIGLLSVFNDANTIYTLDGSSYTGAAGMNAISQASTGGTLLAAYTTFEPTSTPTATAGIFHSKYVVGGSTLQDNYTYGIEGMVVARTGNVLELRGGTVSVNDGGIDTGTTYQSVDSLVTVGPATIVTQDDSTLTNLTYKSIGVGQHIAARGNYSVNGSVVSIDATGTSSANTGSVRILPEQIDGSLLSSTATSLVLNLSSIDSWPAFLFDFNGTGATTAQNTLAAAFNVASTVPISGVAVGDQVLATGTVPGFGIAPPDFTASAVASQTAIPASIRVAWKGAGTSAPFVGLSDTGFEIDLSNSAYEGGVIRIGTQNIDLAQIGGSPHIVPLPLQSTVTTLTSPTSPAPLYNPLFALGSATTGILCFSVFSTFVTELNANLATTPALQFEARGVWDRTTNIFTATTVNVVL